MIKISVMCNNLESPGNCRSSVGGRNGKKYYDNGDGWDDVAGVALGGVAAEGVAEIERKTNSLELSTNFFSPTLQN